MATGEMEDRIQGGIMTDEEDVNLKAMFNEMGAQPKARTKEVTALVVRLCCITKV